MAAEALRTAEELPGGKPSAQDSDVLCVVYRAACCSAGRRSGHSSRFVLWPNVFLAWDGEDKKIVR